MTAAQEPLPCPFCGSNPHRGPTKVEIGQDGEPMQHYRIWCPKLHASITELNEQRAIAAWNTRTMAKPGEVERLREALEEAVTALECSGSQSAMITRLRAALSAQPTVTEEKP